MMAYIGFEIIEIPETSQSFYGIGDGLSVQRDPSDPLFYGSISIYNIVVGTQYWIAQASNLNVVLASGISSSGIEIINNIPSYENPMLVEIRLRKASALPKYKAYKTYVNFIRGGVIVYVDQQLDEVLN